MILIFIGSAGLRVEYWALAKAFVYSLSSCTALVMVLVPKLWGAHKNMGVNVHQLTAEATAMRYVYARTNDNTSQSATTRLCDASLSFFTQHCKHAGIACDGAQVLGWISFVFRVNEQLQKSEPSVAEPNSKCVEAHNSVRHQKVQKVNLG